MITKEQKEKIDFENKRISDNISHIKHRIVVFSGKGGVGKTTAIRIAIAGNVIDYGVNKSFNIEALSEKS